MQRSWRNNIVGHKLWRPCQEKNNSSIVRNQGIETEQVSSLASVVVSIVSSSIHLIWIVRFKSCSSTCKVSLKGAGKELQGSDVLGTAFITPVLEYRPKVIETHIEFTIDSNEETYVTVKEQVSESYDEFLHVPSQHSDHPVKVTASDPVIQHFGTFSWKGKHPR